LAVVVDGRAVASGDGFGGECPHPTMSLADLCLRHVVAPGSYSVLDALYGEVLGDEKYV